MPSISAASPQRRLGRILGLAAPALLLLLGLAALLLGATQARPGYALGAGDRGATRALVRFYGVEQNPSDSYRWSEPRAAVFIYGFEGRPAIVSLRMAAPRPAGEPAAQLGLSVGAAALGGFPVGPGWRRYRLLAPTSAAGETALLLQTAGYQPADDPRPLGVALSDLAVAPLAGQPLLPPPARSLWLLGLPLLAWLLPHRLGARPPLALAAGAALALVAGWAAARPGAAGYLLPSLGWPWWPTLPLIGLAMAAPIGRGLRAAWGWATARPAAGWSGLALALAALAGMRLGLPAPLGVAGLLAGAWAALSLAPAPNAAEDGDAAAPWWPAPAILAILALALFLRLYNLGGQPAGLWRDESRHGLQALRIWSDPGYRPVYVVEGADLPALIFYLMAPVLGLLGPHVWSDRLVAALAGALTPLALLWAAAPLIGRRPALIAAALLAWASWGLSMSRWAFPATLDHLLTLTAIGLAWRGLGYAVQTPHWGVSAPAAPAAVQTPQWGVSTWGVSIWGVSMLGLAGLCAGLATYAYHTGRVAPIALAAIALIRLGRSPAAWRRAAPGLALAAAVGLLTMAPLLLYIAADYAGYNRRVGAVSVFSIQDTATHTPLGLLLQNAGRYLAMWHVRGEPNGRHHMPDAPMLDPASGLLLLLGLALALRSARSPARLALLALPLVYLVPALFSSDAPHAMRALGMLAPACTLAALAVEALLLRPRRHAGQIVAGGLLLFSLAFNAWLYFGAMRVEPRVYGEFDLVETAMGQAAQLAASRGELRVYLPEKLRGSDTVRFLTYGRPTYGYDESPLPADGPALLLLPADASPAAQAEALDNLGPGAAPLGHVPTFPGTSRPIVLAFGRGEAAARLLTELWP